MAEYLTDIPIESNDWGVCKVLSVRREIIHIKHIFTEIFVRKNIDIENLISPITLFDYMEYMTNRIRKIHNISRNIISDPNTIKNSNSHNSFFRYLELISSFNTAIVLDFDGVTTDPSFHSLYKLCIERCKFTYICSANPTIEEKYFSSRDLPLPYRICSMKGMENKKKQLLEIQKKYDFILYVDNETKYLDFAWVFGIKTFHWTNKKIIYYTNKTK